MSEDATSDDEIEYFTDEVCGHCGAPMVSDGDTVWCEESHGPGSAL